MSKLFIGVALAIHRITRYIHSLVRIIEDLDLLLLSVRDGCNPDLSYHFIRPQFNGANSDTRRWFFEGLDLGWLREKHSMVRRSSNLAVLANL
jgi:indoleamine 2,3-dioxygenase